MTKSVPQKVFEKILDNMYSMVGTADDALQELLQFNHHEPVNGKSRTTELAIDAKDATQRHSSGMINVLTISLIPPNSVRREQHDQDPNKGENETFEPYEKAHETHHKIKIWSYGAGSLDPNAEMPEHEFLFEEGDWDTIDDVINRCTYILTKDLQKAQDNVLTRGSI